MEKNKTIKLDGCLEQNVRRIKTEPIKSVFERENLKNYQSPNLKNIGQLSHLIMGNSGQLQDFTTPTQGL